METDLGGILGRDKTGEWFYIRKENVRAFTKAVEKPRRERLGKGRHDIKGRRSEGQN